MNGTGKILRALDTAPDKRMRLIDLHKASGLTHRGFWRVVERMMSERLIARKWDQPEIFTITVRGSMLLHIAVEREG